MKRFLSLVVASLAIVACGGGGDSATNPPVPTPAAVASVNVSVGSASLLPGRTTTASAELRSAAGAVLTGRAISWSSSNTAIATIDGAGTITAVAAGTASVTATSEGRTGTATITVLPAPVAAVSVTLAASTVVVGGSTTANAVARDDRGIALTGRAITWTSSVPSVATVDAAGNVTTIATGTTNIVATAEGQSGSASLIVIPPPVATVSIAFAQSTIAPGATTATTVTLRDVNGAVLTGRSISYTSSTPSVATVSTSGVVSGIAPGTSTITATSEGKSASAPLTVQLPSVSTITVAGVASLAPGATSQFSATLRDASGAVLNGRAVAWSVSDASIATVSAAGAVTAIAPGSVNITATSEGKSGAASLIVRYNIATVTVTGASRVKVGDTYTYSAVARLADGTVVSRPMSWSVRELARATMTTGGSLTPLQTGALTVQVTIDGEVWETTHTSYDWESLSGGGSLFTSLVADNLVTNKFGTSDYPSLVMSCSATGVFYVWVSMTNIVTANGIVAFSFDGGTPIAQTWDELAPDFRTLWKPGSNGTIKAFASLIASARTFAFAFGEFQGSSKATTFRVGGLAPRLTPLLAQCASNAVMAETDSAAAMVRGAEMVTNAFANVSRLSEELVALQAARAAGGATADPGARTLGAIPTTEMSIQRAVKRRP